MGIQVLDRALSGDNGLDKEAEHGEHGKAAILDLLHPQLSEGVWVVSKAQRVEVVTTCRSKPLLCSFQCLGVVPPTVNFNQVQNAT